MPDRKKKLKEPDFIQIPFQLIRDQNLQPIDRLLYGALYWLEHLKKESCTAGNATLGDLLGVSGGTVANSLIRLEAEGYIKRTFKDEKKKHRKEIEVQIAFSKVPEIIHKLDSSNDETKKSLINQTMKLVGDLDSSNDE